MYNFIPVNVNNQKRAFQGNRTIAHKPPGIRGLPLLAQACEISATASP